MKNLAKVLQKINLNVFEKIAFIDDCIARNCCPISVAETMQTIDYNNKKGYWLIKMESKAEKIERKLFAKNEFFEEKRMRLRLNDAYADECTMNGR